MTNSSGIPLQDARLSPRVWDTSGRSNCPSRSHQHACAIVLVLFSLLSGPFMTGSSSPKAKTQRFVCAYHVPLVQTQ